MKKIKQWWIGLVLAVLGTLIVTCFVGTILYFIEMMNSVGKDFIEYFIAFIFSLVLSVFMPYILFQEIKDGVQDKWK